MKRCLIVIVFALMLTGQVWGVAGQEPRMPEPTWKAGDMWKFSVQAPGQSTETFTIIVMSVRDTDYTIQTIQRGGNNPAVSAIPRGSLIPFGPVKMNWPLIVGQRWSASWVERNTNPPGSIKSEVTVEAYELITVPAGSLWTFRIAVRACADLPQGKCGSMRLWIAPKAKAAAKVEVDSEDLWGRLRGATVTLVSYTVTP
jgi:hypothetical protein